MNKKNMIPILIVLLVLQAAVIAYLYRPGQTQTNPSVSLMDTVDAKTVSAMTITDENGDTIMLSKEGPEWVVGSDKFPADQLTVENGINKICGLESARLVSRTKSSHNRLKVGNELFNRKVVLGSDQGDTTFFMGTAPSSKSVHLRISGHDEVYQVAGISAWELQPEQDSWWKSKYVTLEPEAIQGVSITNALGTLNLIRTGDEKNWQFGEEVSGVLDQAKASALIRTISNISISEYLKKDFAIDTPPVCTIEYQVDTENISLQIWPKSEDNDDHVAKLSNAAFFTKIRAYILQEALGATSQGLLQEEPGPDVSPAPMVDH